MRSLLGSPRRLTGLMIAGAIDAIVAYLLMGAAFRAAAGGSGALLFEIVGFVLFIALLAGIAALLVGVVGILVWLVRS